MMHETLISHYKDDTLEQIKMGADFTDRQVILTRFKGQKVWSAMGRMHPEDGRYNLEIIKGVGKARALYAAKWFVNFG